MDGRLFPFRAAAICLASVWIHPINSQMKGLAMRMSKIAIMFYMVLTALLMFEFGWQSYSWLLNLITAETKINLTATSVDGYFLSASLYSLSLSLSGITILSCYFFYIKKISQNHSIAFFSILLAITAISSVAYFLFIKLKIEKISNTMENILVPLEYINFYEIGVFSSLIVFLCAFIFFTVKKKEIKHSAI